MDQLLLPGQNAPAAPHYHAFLMRLWCGDDSTWHASLQATDATARLGFADLDQLIAYLRGLCYPPTDPPADT